MTPLISVLAELVPGATAGLAVSWLFRNWISERLKQSISHEYSTKLENLKSDFTAKLEGLKHEYELNKLRTSLFFDHQRSAFVELLTKIAELNQKWLETYDGETGITEPAPRELYRELRDLYMKHQLFLDGDSIIAVDLFLEVCRDSFSYQTRNADGEMTGPHYRDPSGPYESARYLQPKIAALFQNKIGLRTAHDALRQIALFGAIKLLNRYHFAPLSPSPSSLVLSGTEDAAEAVIQASSHFHDLVNRLELYSEYLRSSGPFYDAQSKVAQYLDILRRAKN